MGDSENAQQPSKKRAALKELSRENPGLDDDEDSSSLETGTFKTATEEVLATRIVRVKRRDPSGPAPSSNPFAGIGLEASKTLPVSNSTSSEGKQETQDDGRSDTTKEIIDGVEKDKSEAIKSEGDGGADETKTTIEIENATRKEIERAPVSDLAGGPFVCPTLSLEFPEPPPGYDTDELVYRQYRVRQLWGLIASAITCTYLRSTQTHRRRRSPVPDLAGGPPVHPPPSLEFPEPPPGYDIDEIVFRQYMASMIRQLWDVIASAITCSCRRSPVPDLAADPPVHPLPSLEFPEPPPGYDIDELVFREYMDIMMRQLWGVIASAITCNCFCSTQTHKHHRSPTPDDDDADTDAADADDGSEED